MRRQNEEMQNLDTFFNRYEGQYICLIISEICHILIQQLRFSAQKQWATYKISDVNLDVVSAKCKKWTISTIYWISDKAITFVSKYMKYHTR